MQPEGTRTEAGFELMARLSASMDNLADQVKASGNRQDRLSQAISPFNIGAIPVNGTGNGVGTLDQPNLLGPRTGQVWDVRQISTTGWTAGAVSVFLDNIGGTLVAYFAAGPALQNYGKGQLLIPAGSRLVVLGAVTGNPTTPVAVAVRGIQMDQRVLADYLL